MNIITTFRNCTLSVAQDGASFIFTMTSDKTGTHSVTSSSNIPDERVKAHWEGFVLNNGHTGYVYIVKGTETVDASGDVFSPEYEVEIDGQKFVGRFNQTKMWWEVMKNGGLDWGYETWSVKVLGEKKAEVKEVVAPAPKKTRKLIANPKNLAEAIVASSFMFSSMQEANDVHAKEKSKMLRQLKGKDYHVEGAPSKSVLVIDKKGRLDGFDAHIDYTKSYITKANLIDVVQDVINHYGENNVPAFSIVTDEMIYYYESIRDKFEGIRPEPTDYFVNVTLLDYQPNK